jgi:hypothetical protein
LARLCRSESGSPSLVPSAQLEVSEDAEAGCSDTR